MKHLHYDHLVISISDQLARTLEQSAVEFMQAGRYSVWPISGYRDEREEVSMQLAFGPGMHFAITDTWLPDDRPPARYDEDSTAFIEAEREALENERMAFTPENVVIYGRFERRRDGSHLWEFRGLTGIEAAADPSEAVVLLNESGYEVVAATETGSPHDDVAWSNMYIFGRRVD